MTSLYWTWPVGVGTAVCVSMITHRSARWPKLSECWVYREVLPMPDVPERCPQCHSPVAERFPHAVMYDCGFSLFNDGQPVTDDYPAECQRRRIKRLEKQLTAARAEAERWRERAERLEVELRRVLPLAKGYAAQRS